MAIHLVRAVLGARGTIDNDADQPNAHRSYTKHELDTINALYRSGRPLSEIAGTIGRSQLGVGWRLLDLGLPRLDARGPL